MIERTIGENVRFLVENLASSWNGGAPILNRLLEGSVGDHESPYALLRDLSKVELEQTFGEAQTCAELEAAARQLDIYLTSETWFDRMSRQDARIESFRQRPVAYFCAEFGLEDWLPIFSGGLGILAGDVIKETSDLGLPFLGIGLFYRRGFFYQQLDENNCQTEIGPTVDPGDLPLTRARDAGGSEIIVSIPMGSRTIFAALWRLDVGRTKVYLLDTDTPENHNQEDRSITASLYGGDHETRIRQELVLGIGGARALRALDVEPSIYSMNEGHAAFLGIELLAEALTAGDYASAVEHVRKRTVYTNHTVMPAGNDVFPNDLVLRYVGPYAEQRGIGADRLLALAVTEIADTFSMPMLAFNLSGKANAVSQIHAQAVGREWPGFDVEVVTNGVHIPTWLGEDVCALFDRYVEDWRGDSPDWNQIYDIPATELWRARRRQKQSMIGFVKQRVPAAQLTPDALTIVWARRFAEYKRAGLIAHDIARLERIMCRTERPVQLVISGKAHPKDTGGKEVLRDLMNRLQAVPSMSLRFAFVEDYGIKIAQQLTAGADIWLNTPVRPLEASGTSGMKSSDNGGLQLTVRDGWAEEVDWWDVGWGIEGVGDDTDAEQMYHFLEDSIVPCFYGTDEFGVSQKWVSMMKNSMVITLSRYSTRRMVLDYVYRLYLPLMHEQEMRGSVSG